MKKTYKTLKVKKSNAKLMSGCGCPKTTVNYCGQAYRGSLSK